MSETERFVSPYLLRRCRSLQEVLRERAERSREAKGFGPPPGALSREPVQKDADNVAPHGQ
jgi:hypothetical protein